MAKIIKLKELDKYISKIPQGSKKIFFSGAFDLFHYGHLRALRSASSLGNILIVQVDGNILVKRRKGTNRPYIDEHHRASKISSLTFVDYVFISNIPSEDIKTLKSVAPDIFIRAILPNETDEDRARRQEILIKKNSKMNIVWLAQTAEISTTKIISVSSKKSLQETWQKSFLTETKYLGKL